jgi:D-alanyl-D-alanine carboxypeptidase
MVKSYVLMDGHNGEVLEDKDAHLIRSVASISKIMTAILALESELDLFYSYNIKPEWTNIEGSSVYLKIDESYRLIDLIYGVLLRSGNDASYAVSNIVSKSTEEFVNKMNEKALMLGMLNTTFHNPCGLDVDDPGNLSTSYDMALLMKYCMENELFREIISTKRYTFGNKVYDNKNKLLKSYEYLLGGKTGYTYKAKRTLVTAAEKDNQYLIMVSLDCGNDYNFHKVTYEKYFDDYEYVVFLNKGINYIDDYEIRSNNVIGIRVKKENIEGSIKEYFIYPKAKELKIYLILNDNKKISYNGPLDIIFV